MKVLKFSSLIEHVSNRNVGDLVELSDLVGKHELSGVDTSVADSGFYEDASYIVFIMDGVTYKAIEDPNDGYRSMMDKLFVCDDKVSNTFYPQVVTGHLSSDGDSIEFRDIDNGLIVLELGTDNSDSYYPSFVMCFTPENFEINRMAKKYNL